MHVQNKKVITVLKIISVVLMLFLLYVSISLYLISTKEQTTNTGEQETSRHTFTEQDPLDIKNGKGVATGNNLSEIEWITYGNDTYGIHFSYPSDFIVAVDEVKHTYEDRREWYYVFFDSNIRRQKVRFSMEVNPDGTGPFFIDKRYFVEKDKDGNIVISSVINATDPQILNDNISWSYAYFNGGKNTFAFHFVYEVNGELDDIDYDAMFVKILESIEIK